MDTSCFPISTHLFFAAWAQAILKSNGSSLFCIHKWVSSEHSLTIGIWIFINTTSFYNINSNRNACHIQIPISRNPPLKLLTTMQSLKALNFPKHFSIQRIVLACNSFLGIPSGGIANNSCTSGDPVSAYILPSSYRPPKIIGVAGGTGVKL